MHLHEFMNETSGTNKIRDVALGGDHTVVLSGNQHDVYTFGKGGEGQLGVMGKPFVSAPVKSHLNFHPSHYRLLLCVPFNIVH